MTGYGKGSATVGERELTVELKAVNGRFLDINARLPRAFASLDSSLRKQIGGVVKRGTLDVYLNYSDKSLESKPLFVDFALAKSYVGAAKKLRTEFALEDDFQLVALMRSPDVLRPEHDTSDDGTRAELLKAALALALDALDGMRSQEGGALKKELASITLEISNAVDELEKRVPTIIIEYREKLTRRLKEITENFPADSARLEQEIAFYIDKSDIAEEIARLRSHIEQFGQTLNAKGEQGRKLDFLTQEMTREVNTVGSKTTDIQNTKLVVGMKNGIERLKEQIRNVE
jgi:uncharacterized protein (TIGR00255 family)